MAKRTFCVCVLYLLSLLSLSAAAVVSRRQRCGYAPLLNATWEQLYTGQLTDCLSSVDLVNAYVARINEVNSTLHAVTELNPDALEIAEQLDREREEGDVRSALHGMPILIKGNIGTADKMNTTAGSYALLGAELPEDSTVVRKLREAGAVILGTTGLSEWANIRSSNSTSGWSAYGGQVSGAYHPDQDPSGSSSGSAVAADLALAFATLGTETGGSIISPSKSNNIVGIKPTVGLTSRHLVVPISQRQDTVGPMARSVLDAARVLQAIAGPDPKDNYTSANPFGAYTPNYTLACDTEALRGKRIGIPRNVLEHSLDTGPSPIRDAFDAAVRVITDSGATIVDNVNFTAYDDFILDSSSQQGGTSAVLAADFVSDLPTYLSQLKTNPHDLHSLEDIREFTQASPLEDYPNRDTALWDAALEAGINNTSPEFWSMYQENLRLGGEGGVLGALKQHNVDALILPSSFAPDVPALVGSPIISVPMGAWPEDTEVKHEPRGELVTNAPGLPIGLSFMGDLWTEYDLIGMAYAYEQASQERGKLTRYIEPQTELFDVNGGV